MNGAILQKSKPPLIMLETLFSMENSEKENIISPEISRMTGTRCEMRARFAWFFTSCSSVTK